MFRETSQTKRLEEIGSVDLDYLKNIHRFHEEWLFGQNQKNEYLAPRVIMIDGDQSLEMVLKEIEKETMDYLKDEKS
jgi:thymidylate kinase